jgi:transcriptional regulator with XRE-family HTH domain
MEHPLKKAREKKKLSQGQLARESGVAKATISRLETGVITNPTSDTLNALEDALDLKRGTLRFESAA